MGLSERDFDCLDLKLDLYKNIDHKIYLRRQEIIHDKHLDGDGRRTNLVYKPTESKVMKLASDVSLRHLEMFKATVETLLDELIPEDVYIFKLHWLGDCLTWEEIAYKLDKPERFINNKRKRILKKYSRIINFR